MHRCCNVFCTEGIHCFRCNGSLNQWSVFLLSPSGTDFDCSLGSISMRSWFKECLSFKTFTTRSLKIKGLLSSEDEYPSSSTFVAEFCRICEEVDAPLFTICEEVDALESLLRFKFEGGLSALAPTWYSFKQTIRSDLIFLTASLKDLHTQLANAMFFAFSSRLIMSSCRYSGSPCS